MNLSDDSILRIHYIRDADSYREPEEAFTEEQINHAVEPTPKDDPWRCDLDEDANLDEFDE